MEYLNEIEIAKLVLLNKDEVMKEALKKVFLQEIYSRGVLLKGKKANPLKNFTLSMVSKKGQYTNEEVGADLRATWEGINALESGFQALEKFEEKPIKSPFVEKNPAV